jgi:glycerol-3-phosphate dehydrogenase (NAD(P)+)
MATILILGAGVMGSAFSFPPADLGHEVRLTGTHLDGEIIRELKTSRIHPKLNIKLSERVSFYYHEELGPALEGPIDLIVLGVSSAGVDWAVQTLGPLLAKPLPIIMLTKGLTVKADKLTILPQYVSEGLEAFGAGKFTVGAVGGPCIAGELAARRDTRVTFAWPDAGQFSWLDSLFRAPYYHINYTADLAGLELCAAMKNFYALAVGWPSGLLEASEPPANKAQMHNLSAGLFAQSVKEMARLAEWMKGDLKNVYGLAGVGDLYVTCQAGRNSRMGRYLGTGMTYSRAKREKMAADTVEGAELALTIGPLLERLFRDEALSAGDYPLAGAIIDAVCHDAVMQIPWASFD